MLPHVLLPRLMERARPVADLIRGFLILLSIRLMLRDRPVADTISGFLIFFGIFGIDGEPMSMLLLLAVGTEDFHQQLCGRPLFAFICAPKSYAARGTGSSPDGACPSGCQLDECVLHFQWVSNALTVGCLQWNAPEARCASYCGF